MLAQSTQSKPDSLSVRIVHAIAEARDVEPIDLAPPLGAVVDSDALDSLGETAQATNLELSFEYAGCQITVTDDNEITVDVDSDATKASLERPY